MALMKRRKYQPARVTGSTVATIDYLKLRDMCTVITAEPVRYICIVCKKNEQVQNKRCATC